MNRTSALVALALSLAPAGVASAQVQSQADLDRFDRQLELIQRQSRQAIDESIPPAERAKIDYGAYTTFAYLSLDDPGGENHVLRQYELVGYARVNFDGAHEFFARGRTNYNDFHSGDAFDVHGDDWYGPTLDRIHYRFDLQRHQAAYNNTVIDYNLVVQGGRQLVTWGNGLTISDVVDGGVATFTYGDVSIDLLVGVTDDDITDFDISRPNFRTHTRRGLYGAMAGLRKGAHQFYGYGLVQQDYNGPEVLVTDGVSTRFEYDSFYLGVGAAGALGDNLLYGVELVYEGGRTRSNSFDPVSSSQLTQTEDDIEAFALDARIEYLLADRRNSRLSAEVILASGDSDRFATNTTLGGNEPGTSDHAFNALGLLNTGLAFSPSVSNLAMLRVRASTYPLADRSQFRRMQVGADFFFLNKLVRDGPIDEPTSDHHYLGSEIDLYLNWQVTSDVSLAIRYGIFFPGSAIETDKSARNFFYAGVTYAF